MSPGKNDRAKAESAAATQALASMQREMSGELVLSSLRAQEQADASEVREEALVANAELRERLVAILGHDLRNPLSTIRMAAELLLTRSYLVDEDRTLATQLLKSATRMSGMITQILDFTRARLGGGMLVALRETDLGNVVRSVADELVLGRSFPIQCRVDGDVTGSLDPDRLAEALSNLVSNAVDHARVDSSVALHVYAEGTELVVDVINEGDPIPAELMPFIFEPFRRAMQQEHSTAGNLGLGLYIAREITRAHRGTVHARSSDGRTTFTIRLPRHPPPDSPTGSNGLR